MSLSSSLERKRLALAGYVEYPGGPLCGNCEYYSGKASRCTHPKVMTRVDPVNGCCNLWESADGKGRDWAQETKGGGDDGQPSNSDERAVQGKEGKEAEE